MFVLRSGFTRSPQWQYKDPWPCGQPMPRLRLPPSFADTTSSNSSATSIPSPAPHPSIPRVDPPLHSSVINLGRINCRILKRVGPEPPARRSCHPFSTISLRIMTRKRGIVSSFSVGGAWLNLAGEAIGEVWRHVSTRLLSEKRTALQTAGRTTRCPWLKGFQQRWRCQGSSTFGQLNRACV